MHRRDAIKQLLGWSLLPAWLSFRPAWGDEKAKAGLVRFHGPVTINGRPASLGQSIQPGDTISTGIDSEAVYVVGQDAYLLRERSSVTLTGDKLRYGLRILTGKLLSVFGKGEKRIETPTATIGIRGTGCYIEAEAKGVYFCLCYGEAEVRPLRQPEAIERIWTKHHDRPVFLPTTGKQALLAARVRNHRDVELVLLESLVGRIPPFVGQPGLSDY